MNLTAGLETYKLQMQNSGQGGPIVKAAPRVKLCGTQSWNSRMVQAGHGAHSSRTDSAPMTGSWQVLHCPRLQQARVAGLRTPYHSPHNVALKKQLTIHQELPLH